jgi:hypothetical protein
MPFNAELLLEHCFKNSIRGVQAFKLNAVGKSNTFKNETAFTETEGGKAY